MGRQGDGETRRWEEGFRIISKFLLIRHYSLLIPQCPMPNAQCPIILIIIPSFVEITIAHFLGTIPQ